MINLQAQQAQDSVLETGSDLAGILTILRYARGVYLKVAVAIALLLLGAGAVMVSAIVMGQLIEDLLKPATAAAVGKIWQLGAVFVALECLSVLAQYRGRLSLAKATIAITQQVRLELFSKLGRLPISYFDYQPLGRTITRLTNDVEGIESFFNGTLARLITSSIQVVAVLVAMILTDLRFGIVIVAASLPSLIFSYVMRRPVRTWMRMFKQRSAQVNAKLAEYLSGLPVIKIFGLEEWTYNSYRRDTKAQLQAGLRTMTWNSIVRPVTLLLCSLPTLAILWLGGEQVAAGSMAIGTLVAFVRYSERFISPIRMISQEVQNIQEALVSSERVGKMLRETEELDTLGADGISQSPLRGKIEYRDVWMGYDTNRSILKGVSFKVMPGMKVGLVGATGSGKTSTVSLIPRFYPIQRGTILLDDQPIETFERASLRSQLGYVSQDVAVFSGTIRENLSAAVERPLTDLEILAACRQTGLLEVLRALTPQLESYDHQGCQDSQLLDHQVIEGGENLSMGERQLLAFTRMQLRSPAILILDEATANIDERCEALIQQATCEIMDGRTCFVIAHRLSTIIQCDLILVFDQGKIIEQGNHQELMTRGGTYAALATQQLQKLNANARL